MLFEIFDCLEVAIHGQDGKFIDAFSRRVLGFPLLDIVLLHQAKEADEAELFAAVGTAQLKSVYRDQTEIYPSSSRAW